MTTTGVTGVEVSFFTACRGLEFDGYLHMKILEILPSVLDRFMANYSSRALDKKEKWEPSFLESSCDHILPEQISWEFPARAAWIFLQDKHEWTIPGGDPWKRTPPPPRHCPAGGKLRAQLSTLENEQKFPVAGFPALSP